MILTSLEVDRAAFAERTGWELKPEGACCGDVCVPLPGAVGDGSTVDASAVADALGMPVLHDDDAELYALGPATATGRTLATAALPPIELPDVRTGELFDLRSLRGQKVLLLAWASW